MATTIGYQKKNVRFLVEHDTCGSWDYEEVPYSEERLRKLRLLESFGAVQGIVIK